MNGKIINQLTKGEWDITSVYGYDYSTKTLFYQSNEGNSIQRAIYAIKLDGKGKKNFLHNWDLILPALVKA